MKRKRTLLSIAMATLVLVSLCAVYASTSVSAAQGSSANVQAPALVGAPTSIVGAPAVCSLDAKSLDLFVRGADGALWWKHWNGTTLRWSTWTSLGGGLTSDPAAMSMQGGLIDVFARGGDGALWVKSATNGGTSWWPWTKIGGQLAEGTGPAACSWASGRLDIFVAGTNHALWYKWYQSATGWSTWTSLGGGLTSSPAATSPGNGVINVFARGGNGALWERVYYQTYSNNWWPWTSLGGQIAPGTGPAARSYFTQCDVFVAGMNGALWHRSGSTAGSFSGWTSLGGHLTSSPSVTSPQNNEIDVFARFTDGALWQKVYYDQWTSWYSIGGM